MASTPRNKKVDPLNELRQRKYEAGHGDAEAFDRQHAKGKLTARERIARLVDRNSFEEIDIFATHRATGFGLEGRRVPGDGVVTGMLVPSSGPVRTVRVGWVIRLIASTRATGPKSRTSGVR